MRYLYSFLFYLMAPFFILRLLWRSRKNAGYRSRLLERFGFLPFQLESCIWLHAVSVGETIAALPLIQLIKKNYPNLPLLITNMTPTGAARVKAALGDTVLNAFIPYDLPGSMQRFLRRAKPRLAIVMETELWPNLFHACAQQNVPVIVTNARLSEKSAKGYQKIPGLTEAMLKTMHTLAVQSDKDAKRFLNLKMDQKRMQVTGNLKFDIEPPVDLENKALVFRQALGLNRLIWIAASTHQGEEEIILDAHAHIYKQNPNALLILVPRHPERFDSVASLIEQKGFKGARRSKNDVCEQNTAVYLADTMGEMMLMYAVCDVAFVAGSFALIGGHNMLEPAVLSKPILTGPQLFNFAEASRLLLEAEGMFIVDDSVALAAQVNRFFADEVLRQNVGSNAYQVVANNRGALQKQFQLIAAALN